MRKFIAAYFVVLLISTAAATTIQSEEVTVDLASSKVLVEMEVEDLTSEKLSYLTSYPARDVEATVDGEEISCEVKDLQIGSEIQCDPTKTKNFTARITYRGMEMVDSRQYTHVFDYTQNVYRPTDYFKITVVLPKGAGLLNEANSSISVISPSDATTGSNGRRIFVEWERNPELGELMNFQVAYEKFSAPINLEQGILILVISVMMLAAGRHVYIRINQEDIETIYEDLGHDEIEVVELLRENEGEMLQKDIVAQLDYSKAKVSGVVSELVDKEVVVKQKEGRSNKLSIAKYYRG